MIAHVDMDAFFAAVEEKYDPSLKGKPLIIGALPTQKRGIVSTANYEARKYGVHSAMPIAIAYRKCPQGQYLRPDFSKYSKESKKVMQILSSFGETEQVGIDEAYLEISGDAKNIAKAIKRSILDETGLSCSIGIASSRYVAKIASDFRKPGGIIIVKNMAEFLRPLPISKIPGVGKKTSAFLNVQKINTIGDFAKLDTFRAMELLGKYGLHLLEIAQGKNTSGLAEWGERKSQSTERTFQEDISREECREYIKKLCHELSEDLEYNYRTVTLKVRFEDFETISRALTPKYPQELEKTALDIFDKLEFLKKIRLIGVRVSNLSHGKEKQLTLREF